MVWELDLNEAVILKNASKRVIVKTKRDKAGKERTSHHAWNGVTPQQTTPSSLTKKSAAAPSDEAGVTEPGNTEPVLWKMGNHEGT